VDCGLCLGALRSSARETVFCQVETVCREVETVCGVRGARAHELAISVRQAARIAVCDECAQCSVHGRPSSTAANICGPRFTSGRRETLAERAALGQSASSRPVLRDQTECSSPPAQLDALRRSLLALIQPEKAAHQRGRLASQLLEKRLPSARA